MLAVRDGIFLHIWHRESNNFDKFKQSVFFRGMRIPEQEQSITDLNFWFQTKYLVENIEQYAYWSTDNVQLHTVKKDVLRQINHLNFSITASEFFVIDRRLLSGVRL